MTGNVLLYAFLATTGTYALTALGAAIVLLWIPTPQQLQTVMALAVGLMLSAVFDLFSSAHEEAVDMYGDIGANIPLLTGGLVSTITLVCVEKFCFAHIPDDDDVDHAVVSHADVEHEGVEMDSPKSSIDEVGGLPEPSDADMTKAKLIVTALALQHIPEALACGVAFGAVAEGTNTTMAEALTLSIAIGLQDIPEGAAAALVLLRMGYPPKKAFFWGQMTGVVQPLAGVLGAAAVLAVKPLLPFALSFAACAMLFVIVRDMVPDCMEGGDGGKNTNAVTIMFGFGVMLFATSVLESM